MAHSADDLEREKPALPLVGSLVAATERVEWQRLGRLEVLDDRGGRRGEERADGTDDARDTIQHDILSLRRFACAVGC